MNKLQSILISIVIIILILVVAYFFANHVLYKNEGEQIQIKGIFYGYGEEGFTENLLGMRLKAYTFIIDNESYIIRRTSVRDHDGLYLSQCMGKESVISLFDYTHYDYYNFEGIYLVVE